MIAMDAGADFIKHLQKKRYLGNTGSCFCDVPCHTDSIQKTGIRVGFKASGGLLTPC